MTYQDEHRIIFFLSDILGIGGTCLDRKLLDDHRRPPDELLRWHFRQAVLENMRGEGELMFEHDLPHESDIMGKIMGGPTPAVRMEFELFSRLRDSG